MIHSFGSFRKHICIIILMVAFLPVLLYGKGGKDDAGTHGAPDSSPPAGTEKDSADPGAVAGEVPGESGGAQFEVSPAGENSPRENGGTGDAQPEALPAAEKSPEGNGGTGAAQNQTGPTEEAPISQEDAAKAAALNVIEMDIRTSTLIELADWCRSLGLSEGGTRDELAGRLRTHYGLSKAPAAVPHADGEGGAQRTITIESARSTEYFTLELAGEEYARLSGNVVISLKEGDAVHRIKAQEIVYNRTRNTMTARGGVEYVKEGGDTIETFRGDSLTVNLDSWAGVFSDGASERSVSDEETAYRFEGKLISRGDEEVTVLGDATITNPKNNKEYWSIHASKIWLMPGSDWAIFNAVLKVGEIPLLYIPFFFLPADEVVFHPVVGYRTREGSYFQTTTYILGRPKASSSSEQSITKLLGSTSDMERTREGLFLRSTGKKSTDPNDTRLSILFDAYANLGVYLGTEFELPKKGVLNGLSLSAGIGFTRDIHDEGGYYTPFAPDYDGESSWNSSKLFSLEVPFRYRLKTSGSMSGKAGNLSWDFPLYSDPYVDKDFMNRSEEMDWMNLVKRGSEVEDDFLDTDSLGSYEMRISASSSQSFTSLKPYISQITLSNLSSFLSFKTRNSPDYSSSDSPDRTFFFPDKFTLFSLSASLSGNPYSYGTALSPETGNGKTEGGPDMLQPYGVPRSPWEAPAENTEGGEQQTEAGNLVPPPLAQTFNIPSPVHWPSLRVAYSLSPGAAVEMQYNSSQDNWKELDDIDWGDISSFLSIARLSGNVSLSADDALRYYSASFTISGDSSWKGYNYINPDASEFNTQAKIDNAKLNNYRSTYFTSFSELSATIRPFAQNQVWGNSSVRYAIKNLLGKTVFDGTASDPHWDMQAGTWDAASIESHKFTTNFAASLWDKNQSFVLDADLPPRDGAITTTANLRFWISETYINGKIRYPFDTPKYDTYTFTETLRFTPARFIRYSMDYNPQNDEITSISAGLGFSGLTASFSAAYLVPYDFNPATGWVLSSTDRELLPKDFIVGYSNTFTKENLWKNRISLSFDVNTSVNFDLQRYTYSNFNFSFGATLKIKDILDITLSSKSANSVIYRYVQDIPFFSLPVTIPGEKNVLIDLFNSFRFDDINLRRSSGFKLKELSLDLIHYMGDWNLNLNITLAPYLDSASRTYKFNSQISFMVSWLPISEIKSEIKYDKDNFTFR